MISTVIYTLIIFAGGVGWGMWLAEFIAKRSKVKQEIGRVVVSLPANPADAKRLFEIVNAAVDGAGEA